MSAAQMPEQQKGKNVTDMYGIACCYLLITRSNFLKVLVSGLDVLVKGTPLRQGLAMAADRRLHLQCLYQLKPLYLHGL